MEVVGKDVRVLGIACGKLVGGMVWIEDVFGRGLHGAPCEWELG